MHCHTQLQVGVNHLATVTPLTVHGATYTVETFFSLKWSPHHGRKVSQVKARALPALLQAALISTILSRMPPMHALPLHKHALHECQLLSFLLCTGDKCLQKVLDLHNICRVTI